MEVLEGRRVPAQFGVPWHDAQHLTVSFVPDETPIGTQHSDLFRILDAQRPTADWQGEILRAFQAWAREAHINFGLKPDDGQPLGVPGPDQEDPRFGDIRIGAVPMSPDVLSISVPHDPFLSGTWSGDILLNSNVAFDDRGVDLFPVLLHEVGHVLGLDHSPDPSSVMFEELDNQRDSLSPGDIAAVQSLYGPRTPDIYEGSGGDETLATAAAIPTPAGFDGTTPLLIYANISTASDVDVYSFQPPDGYQGPVTVRLQTAGVSLLAPRLSVTDAAGTVLGTLASASDTGDTLQLVLPRVDPGGSYDIEVRGARPDVFGIGEYALAVNLDARSTISPAELDAVARQTYNYLSPDDINAIFLDPQGALFHDDRHTDDTFATAASLEPVGAYGSDAPLRITASLGDPTDVDVYRFETPEGQDDGASPDQPLVMTVTVRATEVNGIMPRAVVFDEDRDPVPALVLAHGDGTYTIQVADALPDSDFFVAVGPDPTAGKVVGNYDLNVEFGHVSARPATFVDSALDDSIPQRSYDLVVNQTQLFDFLLSAPDTAAATPSNAALQMSIIDGVGQVVATRSVGGGDTAGGDPVLLTPGVYQAIFTGATSGATPLLPMAFRLYGASLSDPIGPALDDPTLNPVADPTTGTLAAASQPAVGPSGAPYFWLAVGLSAPPPDAPLVGPLPTAEGDAAVSLAGSLPPSAGGVAASPQGRAVPGPGAAQAPDRPVAGTFVGMPDPARSTLALGNGAQGGVPLARVAVAATATGAAASPARVLITYAIARAPLLTPLVLPGPGPDVDRVGPGIELPVILTGETGALPTPTAAEVPTAVESVASPPAPPLPIDIAIQSLVRESMPRVPDTRAGAPLPGEGEDIDPDAAEMIATLGIAALIYSRTHRHKSLTSHHRECSPLADR